MRKIADIHICATCLIVVDSTPTMEGCSAQAECTRATADLPKNWPDYHVHGAGPETCDGSFYSMAPDSRFTLVVHRGLPSTAASSNLPNWSRGYLR